MEENASLSKNTGVSHADINALKEIWYWQWQKQNSSDPKKVV